MSSTGSSPPSAGQCPVQHDASGSRPLRLPAMGDTKGSCPVRHDAPKPSGPQGKVYNVYSQEVDPSNNMPTAVGASQLPVPGQRQPLSTGRVKSTIPKGGTDGTWTYPSPQMFYSALNRKGKGGDVTEADAEAIVAIHNNMNERTWEKVMEWEAPYLSDCPQPKLLKFRGRPDELSPLARVRAVFGQRPFDRHDWVVDRCGKEVRYVIDYYYDDDDAGMEALGDNLPVPHAADRRVTAITQVVRPALDSPQAAWDRVKRRLFSWPEVDDAATGADPAPPATPFPTPRMLFPDTTLASSEFSFLSSLDVPRVAQLNTSIMKRCGPHMEQLSKAGGDSAAAAQAQFVVDTCVGGVVAPDATKALLTALEEDFAKDEGEGSGGGDDSTDATASTLDLQYDDLRGRLHRFSVMSRKVLQHAEEVKE